MFRALLWTQWRESRIGVLLLAAIALVIPVLSLNTVGPATEPWHAWDLLSASMRWSASYPIVALVAAVVLATGAWRPDHRTKHVYALALPIRRSRYLLLRYGAGLTLLLGIGVALLAGATIAALRVTVPPLLHAYPVGLALRFCMAGLVAYTLLFSVAGLTPRAARLLAAFLLLLIIASLVADLLALGWNPVERAMDALLSPYSPLSIFRARWMLIDV
ncbi:MAG: hypothetical protein R2910_08235 [Gemmatimonadales bacterium]